MSLAGVSDVTWMNWTLLSWTELNIFFASYLRVYIVYDLANRLHRFRRSSNCISMLYDLLKILHYIECVGVFDLTLGWVHRPHSSKCGHLKWCKMVYDQSHSHWQRSRTPGIVRILSIRWMFLCYATLHIDTVLYKPGLRASINYPVRYFACFVRSLLAWCICP